MVEGALVRVNGNIYATKLFDWMHSNGIRMYDKQHEVTMNTYLALRTDLVLFHDLDDWALVHLRDEAGKSDYRSVRLFNFDSMEKFLALYEKCRVETKTESDEALVSRLDKELPGKVYDASRQS